MCEFLVQTVVAGEKMLKCLFYFADTLTSPVLSFLHKTGQIQSRDLIDVATTVHTDSAFVSCCYQCRLCTDRSCTSSITGRVIRLWSLQMAPQHGNRCGEKLTRREKKWQRWNKWFKIRYEFQLRWIAKLQAQCFCLNCVNVQHERVSVNKNKPCSPWKQPCPCFIF